MSLTGFGIKIIPISSSISSGLAVGTKVIYEINMKKYNIFKKQYQKNQQTNKSFDKLRE